MGWANGSLIGAEIWGRLRKYVPKDKRQREALWLYERMCDEDADDWCGDTKLEQDAGVNQDDDE